MRIRLPQTDQASLLRMETLDTMRHPSSSLSQATSILDNAPTTTRLSGIRSESIPQYEPIVTICRIKPSH